MTRKLILVAMMAIVCLAKTGLAQKTEVNNAYMAMNREEYQDALDAINKATLDEVTKNQAKTWFYRGQIMMKIVMDTTKTQYSVRKDEAIDEAYKSMMRAHELDAKEEYRDMLILYFDQFHTMFYNMGAKANELKAYSVSYKYFWQTYRVDSVLRDYYQIGTLTDTVAFYAANAAALAELNTDARRIYTGLMQRKFSDPQLYRSMYLITLADKDTTGALKILNAGRELYPNDESLMRSELNFYLGAKRHKELIDKLTAAIEKNPKDEVLYHVLGNAYDNLGQTDAAIKSYERAIEIKPDYFEAYYSLGAEFYNKAVELNKQMNDLDMSQQTKYDELKKQRDDLFMKAIPYFEKAKSINSKDTETLNALKELYARTNQNEKLEDIKKEIEALGK